MPSSGERQQLAHYYPGWFWPGRDQGEVKGLLLFFDGLATLLPPEHFDDGIVRRGGLARELLEAGLLHNFPPEQWLTVPMAQAIRECAFNLRQTAQNGTYQTITGSHFIAPAEDTGEIIEQLLATGVLKLRKGYPTSGLLDLSEQYQAAVLRTVALMAQAALPDNRIHLVGEFGEVTDDFFAERVVVWGPAGPRLILRFDDRPQRATRTPQIARVFSKDVREVGLNFDPVPLDEVLDYRREHGRAYRDYARDLRAFVIDLAAAEGHEQLDLLEDRAVQIADHAADLRRRRRAWRRPAAALTFSAAGAALMATHANPVGAAFAALAAALGFRQPALDTSPFTYILGAPTRPRL